MPHHDIIMVAMDFFVASNSYDFFKLVLFKFAEKLTGLNTTFFCSLSRGIN